VTKKKKKLLYEKKNAISMLNVHLKRFAKIRKKKQKKTLAD